MKYWMMCIESANGILTDSISNLEIAYSAKGVSEIKKNDYILGCIVSPINKITMLFRATKDAINDNLFIEKQMDIADGCEIPSDMYEKIIEVLSTENKCFEITEDNFRHISANLFATVALKGKILNVFKNKPQEGMFVEHINDDKSYTLDELIDILNEMYKNADSRTQSNAIRMFGFKYAESIAACGVVPQKIVDDSDIDSNSYGAEIQKGINMYNSIKNNEYGVAFAEKKEETRTKFDYSTIKGAGENKIFYGTPGCGKSYYIEHDILGKNKVTKKYDGDYKEQNIIRTTFYQDYSNTDFVGQILPKITKGKNGEKDSVEYIFNPGPFTLALIQAISNPKEKVALVVEEINRGNAPAIFGDIFQLLDRDEETNISEYGIVNVGVMDYLNNHKFIVNNEEKYFTFNDIKIPANMYIYATMNTSDQNVYTLDTAFIRRWGKEKIKNSFDKCKFTFKKTSVPGMEAYTWEEFVDGINKCIEKHLEDLQVNEDKQIGAFFVKEKFLKSSTAEDFAYKVFDYLWSDVAKLDHGVFFKPFDTLDKLIEAYIKDGVKVFKSGIFAEKTAVKSQENEQVQEDDSNE